MDIDHFVDKESIPDVIILSTGRDGVLQVNNSIVEYVQGLGMVKVYVVKTDEAIKLYDEMAKQNL